MDVPLPVSSLHYSSRAHQDVERHTFCASRVIEPRPSKGSAAGLRISWDDKAVDVVRL